ncbi:MAG: hypothetical protein Q4A71_00595 [Actinomycetaceae bacterium]|nr:hypothetical protein [Actinomycetaceae bacterium]
MAGSGPRDYSLAEDDSRWRPPKVSRGKWKLWWGVLALQWLIIVAICASYVATGSEMSAPLAAAVTALICLTPVTISLAVKSSRH